MWEMRGAALFSPAVLFLSHYDGALPQAERSAAAAACVAHGHDLHAGHGCVTGAHARGRCSHAPRHCADGRPGPGRMIDPVLFHCSACAGSVLRFLDKPAARWDAHVALRLRVNSSGQSPIVPVWYTSHAGVENSRRCHVKQYPFVASGYSPPGLLPGFTGADIICPRRRANRLMMNSGAVCSLETRRG